MSSDDLKGVIHSDPEIVGGTPVFMGTRVPLQNLIDSLEGGESIEDFLDGFPSVKREQVIARWAEVRRHQVGAEDGVYFLICQNPPTVHVALGKDLKAKVPSRLTEQSLSGLLRTHLQDKDKGLEKAVRLVEHELSRAR